MMMSFVTNTKNLLNLISYVTKVITNEHAKVSDYLSRKRHDIQQKSHQSSKTRKLVPNLKHKS